MNTLVFLVFAFVLFIIAAFLNPGLPAGTPWYGRVHVGWLGLAFYMASLLFK